MVNSTVPQAPQDTFSTTYIVLTSLNIVLHIVGIILLVISYKRGRKTSQLILLINMSAAEVLVNTLKLTVILLDTLNGQDLINLDNLMTLYESIIIIMYTGADYLYLLSLFYITADRLACVLLNIKYQVVWSHKRSRYLVLATWFFNMLVSISIPLIYHYCYVKKGISGKIFYDIINTYVPVVIQCLFIIFAIISYCIMFRIYVTSRRRIRRNSQPDAPRESLCRIFITSQFFVSILIITSTLLLDIIPNVIYTFFLIMDVPFGIQTKMNVQIARNICGMLSDTIHGLIYVLLEPSVRKLWIDKMLEIRSRSHLQIHVDQPRRSTEVELFTVEVVRMH